MIRPAPNFASATLAIARFAMLRHLRSRRAIIAAVTLGLVVVAVAVTRARGGQSAADAWTTALTSGLLSFACYVIPFLFHASSFSEEHEDRTLTYLLVRPVSRSAIVLGKYLAGSALVLATNAFAVLALYLASFAGSFDVSDASQLGHALAAVCLLSLGRSAIAAMYSAIAPEHATPLTVTHFAVGELGLRNLPSLIPMLSMHHHASEIAGVARVGYSEGAPTIPGAASAAIIVGFSVFFLLVATFVASAREYRFAKA